MALARALVKGPLGGLNGVGGVVTVGWAVSQTPTKTQGSTEKFTDTKSRQVKNEQRFSGWIPAGPASEPVCSGWEPVSRPVSRFASAENPAGRFLSRFAQFVKLANFLGKTAPKTSDSWGFRQNQAMGTIRNRDRCLTQKIHGPKPIKTH